MNASHLPASHHPVFDELLRRPDLRLRIGDHVIDVGALRLVTRPAIPRLTSKAVSVLIELARHAGNTVTRDQLLDSVWAGRVTTPDVLTQAIKDLRRAFGDDAKPPRYIETIPKVGYRLLAVVTVLDAGDASTVVSALEAANAESGGDNASNGASTPSQEILQPRSWTDTRLVALLGAGAAFLLGLAYLALRSHPASETGTASWQVTDLRAITSDPGAERRPHISPDGTRLAYIKVDPGTRLDSVLLRAIAPSAVTHLATPIDAADEIPAWSPD